MTGPSQVEAVHMSIFQPGDSLGHYEILGAIAEGGMGSIYRARDLEQDREVAIKALKPQLAQDPTVIRRFLREGELIARLDHESIIEIYDVGFVDGTYYLVMEFLEGRDLLERLRSEGPFSPRKSLKIIRKMTEALDCAHQRGIIHRDVKPSNIFLCDDGSVRLMDFGIARLQEQDSLVTSPGSFLGTPVYMSPEQCRGADLDLRSDIYSIGATLYHMLSGEPPFIGDSPTNIMFKIATEAPVPIEARVKDIPESTAGLIKRLMAKHPAARFQSGHELIQAIEREIDGTRFRTGDRHVSRKPSEAEKSSNSVLAFAGGGLLILVLLGIAFVAYHESPTESELEAYALPAVDAGDDDEDTGDGDDEADSIDDSELQITLEERLDAFEKALAARDYPRLVEFFLPALQAESRFAFRLEEHLESLYQKGASSKIDRKVKRRGGRADVKLVLRHEFSADTNFPFGLTWIWREGDWFCRPQDRLGQEAPAKKKRRIHWSIRDRKKR